MSNGSCQDEYEMLYGEKPSYGYLFYYNGRISKPYELDEFDVLEMEEGKGNPQNLFVRCDACATYMDFIQGGEILKGSWICPKCGKKVRESTPYHRLEQENERFIKTNNENDYDEIY